MKLKKNVKLLKMEVDDLLTIEQIDVILTELSTLPEGTTIDDLIDNLLDQRSTTALKRETIEL